MTWMSGASRHWPDVSEVMAMELLSWRITRTEIKKGTYILCQASVLQKI